jgi:hypothetical protein
MIHCEILAMKELCPDLNEEMDTMIRTLNYINTRPLRSTLFSELGDEMGAQYQSPLFYCNSVFRRRKSSTC